MKQIIFLIGTTILAIAGSAQMKEGKIVYERTSEFISTTRRAGSSEAETQVGKDIDAYQLLFNSKSSLFELLPKISEAGGEGEMRNTEVGFREGKVFIDLTSGKSYTEGELGPKSFVAEGSVRKVQWKITDMTKSILGYKVQKAIAKDFLMSTVPSMENGVMKMVERGDSIDLEAWFAPDIPVKAGPDYAGQLPGLMLELRINNGRQAFIAKEISKKWNASALKVPTKGNRISEAEFQKEMAKYNESLNELLKQRGAGRRRQ
jgi:GLPGLI family protein